MSPIRGWVPTIIIAIILLGVSSLIVYNTLLKDSHIEVSDAKAIYTGSVIGIYMEIYNRSDQNICIKNIEISETIEGGPLKAELHKTVEESGIAKMMPADKVCINPGEKLTLRPGPGGLHIMITGDKESIKSLVDDGLVKISIILDDGSRVAIEAEVKKPGED